MPARRWLLIILLVFALLQVSCADIDKNNISSGIEETQENSTKDSTEKMEKIKQEHESNETSDNNFNEIKPSPKGSFVLGEYVSPGSNYKIKVWAWSGEKRNELNADFVFYDFKEMKASKILRQKLVQNRRTNRREPVKWLDENRVLINGYNLFETNKQELLSLLPSDNFDLIDYHVNNSYSALALLGTEHENIFEVFMIDMDTLYLLPFYSFTVENTWFPIDKLRVAWGPNNILYFEADFNGKPAVYNFDALTGEIELCLIDTVLLSINQENEEISYLEIDREGTISFVENKADINYILKNSDPLKIMQVVRTYMNETNRPVGLDIDKYVLDIKDITDKKAVVAFGPWASEYSGDIILKKNKNSWNVVYERYNYFFNMGNLQDAVKLIKDKTGYIFRESPGNYVIGCPYSDDNTLIFLIGLYNEPWEKEIQLKKYNDIWYIAEECNLPDRVFLVTDDESPINVVKAFFENIKNKQYAGLNDIIINYSSGEVDDKYVKNDIFLVDDIKIENYYVGEARLLEDKINSIVQFWIINDNESEYGWLKCKKVNNEWKIYKNI